jgi:signal transduction histidine kinase
VRLRLTVLYTGLFLLSGAGLLTITYLLVVNKPTQAPGIISKTAAGSAVGPACVIGGSASAAGPVAPIPTQQLGQCLVSVQAAQRAVDLDTLLIGSGIALGVMAVAGLGLGWLISGRVLSPLRTITWAAQNISARNLHERLGLTGPDDEVKELGDTIDGLLARLEGSFAAQRQFVANASHELRTPLARQRTVLEVALADPDRDVGSLEAACQRVLAAGQQQERLIEALLTLARSQRGLDRCERADLAVIAGEAALARYAEARQHGVRVSVTLDPAVVLGDVRLVERLVGNLIDNAVRHNVPDGEVTIGTATADGQAVLTIANTGPVILPAELGWLFEPFRRGGVTRTGDRDSPGLGLSIVGAIAAAHGADLQVRAQPAGGLDFLIRFPAVMASGDDAPEPPGPAGQPPAAPRRETYATS